MHRDNEFVGIEILVVDGDPSVRKGLSDLLTEMGFVPTATGDVEGGVARWHEAIDLFADLGMAATEVIASLSR